MDEQELNKKLAEWAGFKPLAKGNHQHIRPDGTISYPFDYTPNFTQSLDACFKWLAPKLNKPLTLYKMATVEFWTVKIGATIQSRDDSLALALCLAIEKLIDALITRSQSEWGIE